MNPEAAAGAAMAITESLLIALEDNGALSKKEVFDLLTDAAEAHKAMMREAGAGSDADMHRNVAALIERIRDNDDSVRAVRTGPDTHA